MAQYDDTSPIPVRGRLFSRLASRLWHAESEARPARPLRDDVPSLTLADAYEIRAEVDALRMAHGAIPVGRKIGLAARELQELAGVDEPFWAYIFSTGRIEPGATLHLSRYINPRIEPEIALTLRHDLDGPTIAPGDVAAAVGVIQPALEVVDARTSAPGLDVVEVTADSGANAGFILGDPIPVAGVDLGALCRVSVAVSSRSDPSLARSGDVGALMDGPLGCLLWLARHVCARGEPLRAGEIVLTGTLAGAIPVRSGDTLTVAFHGLSDQPLELAVSGA